MSNNKFGALEVAKRFAGKESQELLTSKINLPPVRKDLLNQKHNDQYMDIFYREAIYANSIIDAGKEETNIFFREYISNVNTGLRQPSVATNILAGELAEIFKQYSF